MCGVRLGKGIQCHVRFLSDFLWTLGGTTRSCPYPLLWRPRTLSGSLLGRYLLPRLLLPYCIPWRIVTPSRTEFSSGPVPPVPLWKGLPTRHQVLCPICLFPTWSGSSFNYSFYPSSFFKGTCLFFVGQPWLVLVEEVEPETQLTLRESGNRLLRQQ